MQLSTKRAQNQVVMVKKILKNAVLACDIVWVDANQEDWERDFARVRRSNLLQSRDYASVMTRMNQQAVRQAYIFINGKKAGIFQVLEAGIFKKMIHGVILDRGPLWFEGFGSVAHFTAFLDSFTGEFPQRFGRKIRFLPEMEKSESVKSILQKAGFRQRQEATYKTIWLDLTRDERVLRDGLHKKWRNMLNKSEKVEMQIVLSDKGEYFDWAIHNYTMDKAMRGYDGPSAKTVALLAQQFSRGKNMIIATAMLEGVPIASIVVLIHGSSATYQIGYTSDKGREACAHHLLLWRMVLELKERHIYDFDLGGINEDTKGIKRFKTGFGGEVFEIPGIYY
ncbi:MAG: peptidoglycan bridge formation glycyltransferase FemA/FemB family protein [Alphaproteobacteria bacterium]|nr:peptidoglycan bridge formation glycyltransferase FemA/FemB family protein [Alphaproteobacteria bacterium]